MRLKEFKRHFLRQTTLVHTQVRTDDDDRTAGEVDTFTQKVLTETTLLPFNDFREGFQRTFVLPLDRVRTAAVVEQRVNGLLQHTFFVTNNNLRCFKLDQALQTLVTVDNTAVEVVDVGNGKLAAVKADQRTKIRWQNRQCRQHHPCRVVPGIQERLDNFQTLDDGFTLRFGTGRLMLVFQS